MDDKYVLLKNQFYCSTCKEQKAIHYSYTADNFFCTICSVGMGTVFYDNHIHLIRPGGPNVSGPKETGLVAQEKPTTVKEKHSGSKYIRTISACSAEQSPIEVDVYQVIEAFKVTCPARAHAVKKLLCAGLRGKGSELTDLRETMEALRRAIELQESREKASKA